MYFMSTACGRPQGGGGSGSCGQGERGQISDFFVDIINGWPLSQFFWIQTTESIFLRQGLQTIIYALERTEFKLPLKDDRDYVPRLLFKDMYVLGRIIMFYCLSMCLNCERKKQFADVIHLNSM